MEAQETSQSPATAGLGVDQRQPSPANATWRRSAPRIPSPISMLFTSTVSTEAAGDALGLRPAAVRERIKDGRLVAARVGNRWRVHAASINALLGGLPAPAQPAAQLDVEAVPIFDDADDPFIMRCEMLRASLIPEHAKVGAWMLAKYKRFARSCAVPQAAPVFSPESAFARKF